MSSTTTVTSTLTQQPKLNVMAMIRASSATSPDSATPSNSSIPSNPILQDWFSLNEYGLPPFHLIQPVHFHEAFDYAMKFENDVVQVICNIKLPATFDNTLVALENANNIISLVYNVFSNLDKSHTNEELQKISNIWEPKLAVHTKQILLNSVLYKRICDVYENQRTTLFPDQIRLIETWKSKAELAGVNLSDTQKQRLTYIAEKQAELENQFGQNVLAAENKFELPLVNENDIEGLPSFVLDSLEDGVDATTGKKKYKLKSLSRSIVEPFLIFSAREDLRKIVYNAFVNRGDNDEADLMKSNKKIIQELLLLRNEEASMLSFENYSYFKLVNSMAEKPNNVYDLLEKVWEPAKNKAEKEKQALQKEKQKHMSSSSSASSSSSSSSTLNNHDWHYYSERVRKELFDIDELELKPYFELNQCIQAVFYVTEKLFNLQYEKIKVGKGCAVPSLYHEDVDAYEVIDKTTNKRIAIFLHDNFARSTKRSGAWMSNYRIQYPGVIPIIVNNNNFAKSSDGVTLLSFDDLRTLFHEFGHGLHGTLSNVRYQSQQGTNVLQDFVEFPSQLLEHWMQQKQVLKKFAIHYKTKEPIPDALLDRLMKSLSHNKSFDVVEYVGSVLLDMQFHKLTRDELTDAKFDAVKFENEYAGKIGMPKEIGFRHRSVHFQHLFATSAYASNYYVYIWAQILDADGFEAFLESGDIFNSELALKLKEVYSSGDKAHPMTLYKAFRGREPSVTPLLKKLALI